MFSSRSALLACWFCALLWLAACTVVVADEPILRVNSTGTTSFVTSLGFSPDGNTLYSAGFDKVVRVWQRDQVSDGFEFNGAATYRVPIGAGTAGFINCIAVSPDGSKLVVGGEALMRGANSFRKPGAVFPKRGGLTEEMRLDQGRLFVFDTRTREVSIMRRHNGPVLAIRFLPNSNRYLVSAADEWDGEQGERVGGVRLLDLETEEELSSIKLPELNTRPGLVFVGDTERDVARSQIAIAWGDGQLRMWDVAARRVTTVPDGGPYNVAIDRLEGSSSFVTGKFETADGAVTLWNLGRGSGRPTVVGAPLTLDRWQDSYPFPRDLAVVRQRNRNSVVVASRMTVPPATVAGWQLDLLEIGSRGLAESGKIRLTDIPAEQRMPVLECSSDGEWIALAGSGDQAIRIYRTEDLRSGRNRPQQVLAGSGQVMAEASFVRRGEDQGIRLLAKDENQVWQLDLASRQLNAGEDADWQPDAPDRTGWTMAYDVQPLDEGFQANLLLRGRGLPGAGTRILLPQNHEYAAHAFLPNNDDRALPVEIPLLAIASHRNGLPRLAIYNAITGETIRELSGHVERILALSFRRDGRYLLSTGNDQTVCVWSLNDLDVIVGQRGGVNGLALDSREGEIAVVDIAEEAKVAELLEEGDVLESIEIGGDTIELTKAATFYETMWRSKPGTEISIRRAGKPDVDVTVEQGVDERKPLFLLHVAAADPERDEGREWNWVGWSPLGPYDSSGGSIETQLGWHFNGDDTDGPVRFALLEEYDNLRREDLLQQMLELGDVPPPPATVYDPPEMRLRLAGSQHLDELQAQRVNEVPSAVELAVIGLTPRQIEGVQLIADGELVGDFEFDGNQRWRCETGLTRWERGNHRLTARLTTREVTPQQFDVSLNVDFFVSAPEIMLPQGREYWTDENQLTIPLSISPADTATVDLMLIRKSPGDDEIDRRFAVSAEQQLDLTVELSEGWNHFELTAVNRGAEAETRADEFRSVSFVVAYEPALPEPPASLEVFLDLRAEGEAGPVTQIPAGDRVATQKLAPRLLLSVESANELPEMRLTMTAKNDPEQGPVIDSALRFREEEGRLLTFVDSNIDEPGEYLLQVLDLTNDLELYGGELVILPRLPAIEILRPSGGEVLLQGRDQPVIELEALIAEEQATAAFELQVLVNGEAIETSVNLQEGRLLTELPLSRGENRIVVQVSNAYETKQSRPSFIRFRVPPVIVAATAEQEEGPETDLRLQIDSPTALTDFWVNGQAWPDQKTSKERVDDRWDVVLQGAGLDEGENRFEILVANVEAEAIESAEVEVEYTPPRPLDLADVVLHSPSTSVVVDVPQFEIDFEVVSTNPLIAVELHSSAGLVFQATDVEQKVANARGEFVVRSRVMVDLRPGDNHFKVVARNQGGTQEIPMAKISYQEPPVRLFIEGVSIPGRDDELIRPRQLGDGRIAFDEPLDSDVVIVHAVADWRGLGEDFRRETTPTIQVSVNEFLQISDGAVQGDLSRFRLPLLLSQDENDVQVVLPHYKGEASSQSSFSLRCSSPSTNKRLHLLIVGIGSIEADSEALQSRVLESLRAERQSDPLRFRTETFQNGLLYRPLVGNDLNQGEILTQLINIQDTIRRMKGADNYHDVVMLYVEGGRIVSRDGEFVVTTRPADSPISMAIASDPYSLRDYSLATSTLRAMVMSTEGAKILMLDMLEGEAEESADVAFEDDTSTALLRFTWVDGASTQEPFPAFLDAIANSDPADRISDLTSRFQQVADSNPNMFFQKWVAPTLEDFVLVLQPRVRTEQQEP